MSEQSNDKVNDAPRRQYYFRSSGCYANFSGDPDCVCWYDEGTGPLSIDEQKRPNIEWREVPRLSNSSAGTTTTANPERRSSPGHSEVKPDGNEGRSGEVDREGGGRTATARGDAVGAGRAECGPRQAGSEADQEGLTRDGAAKPASSFQSASTLSDDAERYRLIRHKLCNRESLEFNRLPSVSNLAGLASIETYEIDAAVDAMRVADRKMNK